MKQRQKFHNKKRGDGREEIFKRKCRQFSRIKKCHDFSDRKYTLNTKQNKINLHVDTSQWICRALMIKIMSEMRGKNVLFNKGNQSDNRLLINKEFQKTVK